VGDAEMKLRDRIAAVAFAVSAVAYFPFSQWIATTPVGTQLFLWGQMIYGFPLMVAVLSTPVAIIGVFIPRTRRQSLSLLAIFSLFVPCCIAGIIFGHKVRNAGMRTFAERSQSLIAAIQKYEQDHSAPPNSLQDLVPVYIPVVPTTGMMAYPEYGYHTGEEAKKQYRGNSWALSVPTPSGGINWDMMLYFPNQDYPRLGYGGGLERIEDWAYVHE